MPTLTGRRRRGVALGSGDRGRAVRRQRPFGRLGLAAGVGFRRPCQGEPRRDRGVGDPADHVAAAGDGHLAAGDGAALADPVTRVEAGRTDLGQVVVSREHLDLVDAAGGGGVAVAGDGGLARDHRSAGGGQRPVGGDLARAGGGSVDDLLRVSVAGWSSLVNVQTPLRRAGRVTMEVSATCPHDALEPGLRVAGRSGLAEVVDHAGTDVELDTGRAAGDGLRGHAGRRVHRGRGQRPVGGYGAPAVVVDDDLDQPQRGGLVDRRAPDPAPERDRHPAVEAVGEAGDHGRAVGGQLDAVPAAGRAGDGYGVGREVLPVERRPAALGEGVRRARGHRCRDAGGAGGSGDGAGGSGRVQVPARG